jgi:hypothetical protein
MLEISQCHINKYSWNLFPPNPRLLQTTSVLNSGNLLAGSAPLLSRQFSSRDICASNDFVIHGPGHVQRLWDCLRSEGISSHARGLKVIASSFWCGQRRWILCAIVSWISMSLCRRLICISSRRCDHGIKLNHVNMPDDLWCAGVGCINVGRTQSSSWTGRIRYCGFFKLVRIESGFYTETRRMMYWLTLNSWCKIWYDPSNDVKSTRDIHDCSTFAKPIDNSLSQDCAQPPK